jgi:hypothetical protein
MDCARRRTQPLRSVPGYSSAPGQWRGHHAKTFLAIIGIGAIAGGLYFASRSNEQGANSSGTAVIAASQARPDSPPSPAVLPNSASTPPAAAASGVPRASESNDSNPTGMSSHAHVAANPPPPSAAPGPTANSAPASQAATPAATVTGGGDPAAGRLVFFAGRGGMLDRRLRRFSGGLRADAGAARENTWRFIS